MNIPPGPRGIQQSLRSFLAFTKDPHGAFARINEKYGPVASVRVGTRNRVVFVSDPQTIGEVLLDKDNAFVKDEVTRSLSLVLGSGLLTNEGDRWRRQRRIIAPSLSKSHIANYSDSMVRIAHQYTCQLGAGEVRDAHKDFSRVTLDIVLETLFGSELPASYEHIGQLIDWFMHDFDTLVHSWRRLFPDWFPFRARIRSRRAAEELSRVMLALIAAKRSQATLGPDLLSRLIEARDETDPSYSMTDEQLRDETITMFLAGHETTANTLAWTSLLLADHPSVADELYREIDEVLEGRPVTPELAAKLPFTKAVIEESMRLYPPAHIIGRQALRDVRLGPWDLPKGSMVLISPFVLHRSAEHFSEPLRFDPTRWLTGQNKGQKKFTYMPFGAGPRICIGNHFAMLETIVVLATVSQKVRFARISNAPVPAQVAITYRPLRGVPLRVLHRQVTKRSDCAHAAAVRSA